MRVSMIRKCIPTAWVLFVVSGLTAQEASLLEIPLRINMGGVKTEDSLGRIWLGDGPGPGDPLNIRPDDAGGANWIESWNFMQGLAGTIPESLENLGYDPNHPGDAYIFSTIRWDDANVPGEFRMDIPVPNGDYQLNMYFNEA